jgi:hypothetical protein
VQRRRRLGQELQGRLDDLEYSISPIYIYVSISTSRCKIPKNKEDIFPRNTPRFYQISANSIGDYRDKT